MSKSTDVKTPGYAAIAKKWNLSMTKIISLVNKGAKVEQEHTKSLEKAKQIARDHIAERPDYYKKLDKMEKSSIEMKEENTTSAVRGLGYVTNNPAIDPVAKYVNTNVMSYNDDNGNKFEYVDKSHKKLHAKLGFKEFDPRNIDKTSNKDLAEETINELGSMIQSGMSGTVGLTDPPPRMRKNVSVEEGKKLEKAKRAAMAGITAANIYTLGDVAGRATEGQGSPKKDIVAAATALPGAAGWGASSIHYAKKAYDYVKRKNMNEEKNIVPAETTARGIYETSLGKRIKYAIKSMSQSNRIAKDLQQDATKDKTYQKRTKGIKLSMKEDWQKVNRKDRTSGLSQAAVNAYRRENPGSKLQTAVTEKNPTGKRAARRKSFCSRMGGMKKRLTSAKTARDPNSRINKALRRWNCEETQINEVSAKLVGKVHNRYLEKGKAPPSFVLKAVKKKWLESQVGKIKKKKDVKENRNRPDTNCAPGATGITKTIYEGTKMNNKEIISEVIDNILTGNLNEMQENLYSILQEKANEKLEERKKVIASQYFGQ